MFKHQSPSLKEGDGKRNVLTEFNSDNVRLDVEQTKDKIASLEYIQNELNGILNIVQASCTILSAFRYCRTKLKAKLFIFLLNIKQSRL